MAKKDKRPAKPRQSASTGSKRESRRWGNTATGLRLFKVASGIVSAAGSALMFTFGGQGMSTADTLAPWLMAIGALLVVVTIMLRDEVWDLIKRSTHRLEKVGLIAICVTLVAGTYLISRHEVIRLSNIPTFSCVISPASNSSHSGNSTWLLLGNTILVEADQMQNYVLMDSGKPFLSIGLNSQGRLILSTTLRDNTGKHVVSITNNHVLGYQKYVFWPSHPNNSTFIVADSEDNEVLHVFFEDPKTIYVTGVFYLPSYSQPVNITSNDGMTYPGGGMDVVTANLTGNSQGFINFSGNTVSILPPKDANKLRVQ